MIGQCHSSFAGSRRCFGWALQNGVASRGEVLFADMVRVILNKCFPWVWISHGTLENVFHCLPTVFNCCSSLVDVCFDWEHSGSAKEFCYKKLASPKKLWESPVKQRGIALVEEHITESYCKIQPPYLLPVCLARKEGGGWSWTRSCFCSFLSSFVCGGKICSGSSCCNLLPGLGWPCLREPGNKCLCREWI